MSPHPAPPTPWHGQRFLRGGGSGCQPAQAPASIQPWESQLMVYVWFPLL